MAGSWRMIGWAVVMSCSLGAGAAVAFDGAAIQAPAGAVDGLVITPLRPDQMTADAPVVTALPDADVVRGAPPEPDVPAGGNVVASLTPAHPGLPEPSIIIGDLARLVAPGLGAPLGPSYDQRQAIQDRDPDLFRRLLSSGGFDPQPDQMVAAIQTELGRMRCYAGGVDGMWGAGSVAALTRFFAVAGGQDRTVAPTTESWRFIVMQANARCPQPEVAAPPQAARNPTVRATPPRVSAPAQPQPTTRRAPPPAAVATTPRTPRRTVPVARTPAPAPAAPSGQHSINPNLIGSGVFR